MFIFIQKAKIMKHLLLCVTFIGSFYACQSVKIDNETYLHTAAKTEIGSVGVLNNHTFNTKMFPKLGQEIRLDIRLTAFEKKTKISLWKKKAVSDTLKTNTEVAVISILDVYGYINELNDSKNQSALNLLKYGKPSNVVKSVVVEMTPEELLKIKAAKTFYLNDQGNQHYTISLYNGENKTDELTVNYTKIIGYQLYNCCWAIDKKGKWFLANLIKPNESCTGETSTKIKEKETTKNLYKM
jgi:hypothetical protein